MVVMLGNAPMSYVIPSFPASFQFVRPQSNLSNPGDNYGLALQIKALLKSYGGKLYVLYDAGDSTVDLGGSTNELQLQLIADACRRVQTDTGDDLELCPAIRVGEPQ
jgi:hypothetical protein